MRDPVAYWTETLPAPVAGSVNTGMRTLRSSTLVREIGMPRERLTDKCLPPTNKRLLENLTTLRVHDKWKAYGDRRWLALVGRVLERVKLKEPTLYPLIGHAGTMCCRKMRGSDLPSLHGWGVATDFTIGGVLDRYGDGRAQRGLFVLYREFKVEGAYWGVSFGTEDAMHYNPSEELWLKWTKQA